MAETQAQFDASVVPANGASALESRLRSLFDEQQRLRELLDRTRAELDAVNAEVLRFQDEYCTDAARESEYDDALERILGFNPRTVLHEIQQHLSGERVGCDMGELIRELEAAAEAEKSRDAG